MLDTLVIYGNVIFRLFGWLLVLYSLVKYHYKGEEPTNWRLLVIIVFLV